MRVRRQDRGGRGIATTISSYAAGAVDFAFADSNLIIARSRGVKVKVAGIIHDKSLYAIGTLIENHINSPQDLKGKWIGAPVGDAGRNLFSGFAKLNGLDPASVQWVDMTAPARAASLVLGQVDAVSLFLTETPTFAPKVKEAGKAWKDLPFADFGFDLYSSGLLVREDLIAKDPGPRAPVRGIHDEGLGLVARRIRRRRLRSSASTTRRWIQSGARALRLRCAI
jgi:NitT/TauT family transport system substrate-binding protein